MVTASNSLFTKVSRRSPWSSKVVYMSASLASHRTSLIHEIRQNRSRLHTFTFSVIMKNSASIFTVSATTSLAYTVSTVVFTASLCAARRHGALPCTHRNESSPLVEHRKPIQQVPYDLWLRRTSVRGPEHGGRGR